MSLKAGTPRKVSGKYLLDDTALANSMALAIDKEMKALFEKIKGASMPDAGQDDRRMLFTAISRGILKYLRDHAGELLLSLTIAHITGYSAVHSITTGTALNIQVDDIPS
jgi:hypothetical protein